MIDIDTREWLLTNGLGSFASGTVSDVRTRTYHGWLFAATSPPSGRTLLLSHLEASLELTNGEVALGTNFWSSGKVEPRGYQLLRSFENKPVPKWSWGGDDWLLSRQMLMPHCGGNGDMEGWGELDSTVCYGTPLLSAQSSHRILIHYNYEGKDAATLKLRLMVADRDFHRQQKGTPELQFSQMLAPRQVCLQAINTGEFGTPWHLCWTKGDYQSDAFWYWNYGLPEETRRGLGDREDIYSPGYLVVRLQPGDNLTLEARVGFPDPLQETLNHDAFAEAVETEQERLSQIFGVGEARGAREQGGQESNLSLSSKLIWQQLLQASDQFIVYRDSVAGPTAIAGYHWFNDWGRDTLIALPGLALVPKRFDLAKGLLHTLGRYCRYGLIPNAFPDTGDEPFYNSIDGALWWIETLGLYLEATQDWDFLAEQYPVVQQIYKAFVGGTRYNIQVDSTDGLISWYARGLALTWMDVVIDGHAITPRRGKPVEINALWYSALCWASRWAEILSERQPPMESVRLVKQAQRYIQQAQQVKDSLQKFWNPQIGYLYDIIEPDDRRNSQIRPNAVLALSLRHCGFSQQQAHQILKLASSCLLTPYGLRTLDPADPEYIGEYKGNQQERDRAYHQGTVWSWLIGPFVRAKERFNDQESRSFDWQPILEHFLSDACLGSVSQIFDGDYPHLPRGAIAQASSVAEVIRHF
jgi:predicted glycogen debranching enzyme